MSDVSKLYSKLSAQSEYYLDIGEHLELLHDLVVKTKAQVVVELGPGRGNRTSALLTGVEKTSGNVWSCDVERSEHLYAEVSEHPQWTFVLANDLDAVNECPRPIDVLFIDSEHTYDQTVAEMRAYVPLVRSGGYVAMHDTVVWKQFMVPAIRDYAAEHPFASEEWLPNCNGLFVAQTA